MRGNPLTHCLLTALALFSSLWALEARAIDEPLQLPESVFPELTEILSQLEEESPDMLIRRALVQAAEANEQAALAPKWPDVDLNLQLTNRSEFRDSDPTFQNTTQPFGIFRVEQDLYHWGALDAQRDIGKFLKAIEENNYDETYRLLVLRIRNLYLRLLYSRSQATYYQAELSRMQQALERSEKEASAGRITPDQLELERLEIEQAQIQFEQANNEATMLEEDLRLASGWQGPIHGPQEGLVGRFQTMAEAEAREVNQLVSTTAPPSVKFLNKQEELNIEEANYVRIRSKNLPLFDVVAEGFQDQISSQGADNIDRRVLAVFLRISWNIFDGFETKWEKIQSKAQQRALEREAIQIAERDRLEVERLTRQRDVLQRNISVWARRVSISRNTVDRVASEVKANNATDNQLQVAQNALLFDQITLAGYRVDLFENSSELLSIYGQDPFGTPKHPLKKPVEEVYDENFFF